MSNLKQIVQNDLRVRNVSPELIASVDTYIQRAILDLQKDDILPARTWTFTSLDQKQERRDSDGDLVYNYYYMPDDFRKLEAFRPRGKYIWEYTNDQYKLYNDQFESLSEDQRNDVRRKFTIEDIHQNDDSKTEKVLIAYPFPEDDTIVEIKYWSNGKNQDWEWIDEDYWEAIISWI